MDKATKIRIGAIGLFVVLFVFSANNYRFSPTGMVVADIYDLDYALENLDELKDKYNTNIDRVPNFVKTIFGNEKMKVEVTRLDGTITTLSVETKKGMIETVTKEEFDKYTLNVWIGERTINEVMEAEDQIERLKQAIDNEEVRYQALRFKTRIKIWFSKIFLAFI